MVGQLEVIDPTRRQQRVRIRVVEREMAVPVLEQTLLGRRRYLPDLGSRNRVQRNAAERMAVNTVIQGTAADLIKKAMIAVDARLAESGLGARMILQVHDELVFEVPAGGLDALAELVREQMENVLSLRVPLLVDVGTGSSWREAH